jgi:hypothetical protein
LGYIWGNKEDSIKILWQPCRENQKREQLTRV